MASALGRLEKCRGNATLHGFLYSIDPCIQSFKIVYHKTGVNVWCSSVSSAVKSSPVRLKSFEYKHQIKHMDGLKHYCHCAREIDTFLLVNISFWKKNVDMYDHFKANYYFALCFLSLSLWLSFVSSVYVAKALWTSAHRWLCGCCCHLLMSPVMMWGWFFLETASQSQDSIISFKQNKVRQRQLWTNQEREAASLSSANHFANTFEVVTCLWKM